MLIILAGIVLGAFGQGIRTGLGIVKNYRARADLFAVDYVLLTLNLVVGAIAGVLTVLMLAGGDGMSRALAAAAIAAGYAGPDAIESMLNAARRVAVWWLAVVGLGMLMLLAPSARASSPPAAALPKCDAVTEISKRYRGDSAVVWRLPDDAGAKLVTFFTHYYGAAPPVPIGAVWMGLDGVDQSVAFFFMAGTECVVTMVPNLDRREAIELLDALGIDPPIGGTYYQIPNTPGGLPGANVGPPGRSGI